MGNCQHWRTSEAMSACWRFRSHNPKRRKVTKNETSFLAACIRLCQTPSINWKEMEAGLPQQAPTVILWRGAGLGMAPLSWIRAGSKVTPSTYKVTEGNCTLSERWCHSLSHTCYSREDGVSVCWPKDTAHQCCRSGGGGRGSQPQQFSGTC